MSFRKITKIIPSSKCLQNYPEKRTQAQELIKVNVKVEYEI